MRTKNSTSQQESVEQRVSDAVAEEQEAPRAETTEDSGAPLETDALETAEEVQSDTPTRKKRIRRKITPEEEKTISPGHSVWPLVLALALIVLFLGIILHPIVLVIGIIMLVGSAVGWIIERH